LLEALDEESKEWIVPAIDFLKMRYEPETLKTVQPLSTDAVKKMMGWKFD
jgi:hypothetical protein